MRRGYFGSRMHEGGAFAALQPATIGSGRARVADEEEEGADADTAWTDAAERAVRICASAEMYGVARRAARGAKWAGGVEWRQEEELEVDDAETLLNGLVRRGHGGLVRARKRAAMRAVASERLESITDQRRQRNEF